MHIRGRKAAGAQVPGVNAGDAQSAGLHVKVMQVLQLLVNDRSRLFLTASHLGDTNTNLYSLLRN